MIGVGSIARATVTINDRAVAQTNADSVALVAADRGVESAREFARTARIDLVDIEVSGDIATATVRVGRFVATADALKPE